MKKLIIFFAYAALAFGPTVLNGQDHAVAASASQHAAHKPQGFADYTLGKINPNDADYGASLDAARGTAVMHTIDDLYFWSNVVAITLLSGVTAVFLFHLRAADKKEIIASTLIAQLWNGRVSDRIEIERRTEQYNALVDQHNAVVERELMARAREADRETQPASDLNRTVGKITDGSRQENRVVPQTPFEPMISGEKDTAATGGDLGRLQQEKLLLERRVEAMRNTEQNLKERLNQTTSLLDQERRRNQTLKGA